MNVEPTMAGASTFAPTQKAHTLAHVGQAMCSWNQMAHLVKVCSHIFTFNQRDLLRLESDLVSSKASKLNQNTSSKLSIADINECSNNNGDCQHTCNNEPGSYFCSCDDGYALANNNRSCSGRYLLFDC